MRLTLFITFMFCLLARGNPVPGAVLTNAYIASERLVVTLSPAEAKFVGTFTFKVPGGFPKWTKGPPWAGMAIPVWFPERNDENPNVAEFWGVLRRGGLRPMYLLAPDLAPSLSKVYKDTVGLTVHVGELPYKVGSFDPLPRELDTPGREYFGFQWWRGVQETGFCILRFQVTLSEEVFAKARPVRISYRQPLLNVNGDRRFYYAPILDHLPAEIRSTDTDIYAISLEATPDCELAVSYGDQHFNVAGGQNLTLAPKHFQPIRAIVTPRPNGQGGANGRRPFNSDTNRTSAAAASRRSPDR